MPRTPWEDDVYSLLGWDGAMAGDARFTKELLDRMEGSVTHTIAANVEIEALRNRVNLQSKLLAARSNYKQTENICDGEG
jgi:hypothetical protein